MLQRVKGFSEVKKESSYWSVRDDECGHCPVLQYSPLKNGSPNRNKWACKWEGCRLSHNSNGFALRSDTCMWNNVKEYYNTYL